MNCCPMYSVMVQTWPKRFIFLFSNSDNNFDSSFYWYQCKLPSKTSSSRNFKDLLRFLFMQNLHLPLKRSFTLPHWWNYIKVYFGTRSVNLKFRQITAYITYIHWYMYHYLYSRRVTGLCNFFGNLSRP